MQEPRGVELDLFPVGLLGRGGGRGRELSRVWKYLPHSFPRQEPPEGYPDFLVVEIELPQLVGLFSGNLGNTAPVACVTPDP